MVSLSSFERHILELWYEAGTVSQGAAGVLALEWESIIAWANQFYSEHYVEWVEHPRHSLRHKRVYTPLLLKQCTLLDVELQLIRRLSQEYASEYQEASDPKRECPKTIHLDEITDNDKLKNADAIEEGLLGLFGVQQGASVEVVINK